MNTYIVDLSNNQPPPYDFRSLRDEGVAGAVIKASEGTYYRNELLDYAVAQARSVPGTVLGFYHYGTPMVSTAANEAQKYLSCLPSLDIGDLLAFDIESENKSWLGDLSGWSLEFLTIVRNALRQMCLVYSYPDFITRRLTKPELAPYPLWLADLGDPNAAGRQGWGPWPSVALRQYTWTSRHQGISHGNSDVDQSVFYGDVEHLKRFGKPAPPPIYPYHTSVTKAGALKAATPPGGKWAGLPSHLSNPAIDEHRRHVSLKAGQQVIVTGTPVHTDDIWIPCSLLPPSPVHGWYLERNLLPHPTGD